MNITPLTPEQLQAAVDAAKAETAQEKAATHAAILREQEITRVGYFDFYVPSIGTDAPLSLNEAKEKAAAQIDAEAARPKRQRAKEPAPDVDDQSSAPPSAT